MNTPYDYINFMSNASYRPLLRKWSRTKNQIPLALNIKKLENSTEKDRGMIKK